MNEQEIEIHMNSILHLFSLRVECQIILQIVRMRIVQIKQTYNIT